MATTTSIPTTEPGHRFTDAGLPSDEQLLLDYRATGCQEAFEELVRRHERGLYSFLRRFLGDAGLAEDVFQRTFLQVHLKRGSYQEGRRVRPWIYRIATNQAIDALRRGNRHRAVSLNYVADDAPRNGAMIDAVADPAPPPTAVADRREQCAWSRRAVDALPPRLRLVVQLIFFRGLTYREAAERLALPLGTVKSRMNLALQKMRHAWEDGPACGSEGARAVV